MAQKEGAKDFLENLVGGGEKKVYEKLHWQGNFEDYLEKVKENPKIVRTAFQRLHDMILSHGVEFREDLKKEKVPHYYFFEDVVGDGSDKIYGLDRPLMNLVNLFKAAAEGYGIEKRILLLHGPVGGSKSTIVRLLKKGLEDYTKTDEGILYTFGWKSEKEEDIEMCPMHEDL